VDPEEGNNPKPADNTARQRLKDLRVRLWPLGKKVALGEAPATIECLVMDKHEVWRRVGGPSGEATLYELERQ